MNEEKLKILGMLEKGSIDSEEAARLLDALGEMDKPEKSGPARWLRIRVSEGGEEKVKVNLPIKLVQILTKLQGVLPEDARHQLDEHDIDLEKIVEAIREGAEGEIISVQDGSDDVRITVE